MMHKIRILFKKIFLSLFGWNTLLTDKQHARGLYFIEFGKFPDLDKPETFNEHVSALKIKDEKLGYSSYTDKVLARDYVARLIPEKHLNKVLGVYSKSSELNFDILPNEFVLKATHGSGNLIIVRDKARLRPLLIKKKCDAWINENYYLKSREKNYKDIKPGILCEALLKPKNGQAPDEFKFFCFGGEVKFIQHNSERNDRRRSNLYDEKWGLLPVRYGYDNFPEAVLPANTAEMIKVAEKLSGIFSFVRVDLYNIDADIYFSELTFHPGGGHVRFSPDSYDLKFGGYFK